MKQPSDLRIPFAWKDRKTVLLDKFLYIPTYFHNHELFGRLDLEAVFPNRQPLSVEYCSGNGQWICSMASAHPERNWIAVDMDFARARKTWLRLFREGLSNLLVVCGEGIVFTRHYLPKACCSCIYVNFPDPWPKRIHAKHRIVRKVFLDEIEQILLPNSPVVLATDDEAYSEQMIRLFRSASKWRSSFDEPYYTHDLDGAATSYFLELWKQKERNIRTHRFVYDCA
jgi:tRNA (guanine-N7-)-methyltransferase